MHSFAAFSPPRRRSETFDDPGQQGVMALKGRFQRGSGRFQRGHGSAQAAGALRETTQSRSHEPTAQPQR